VTGAPAAGMIPAGGWVVTVYGPLIGRPRRGPVWDAPFLVPVRDEWYAPGRAALAGRAGEVLADLAGAAAAELGGTLHHANLILTGDPEVVRHVADDEGDWLGQMVTDWVVGWLAAHPGGHVVAGRVHWSPG
jgi:hypothetical protein